MFARVCFRVLLGVLFDLFDPALQLNVAINAKPGQD